MVDVSPSWLQRYRAVQRPVNGLFWVVVIGLQGVLNTAVTLADLRAAGLVLPWWQPVSWEATSHLMVLLLIPAVVAWNRRFPLHWDTLRRHLPWHLLGSVLFSLLHVAGMVGARIVLHALLGERYDFGPWLAGWLYEYLKDVRAYLLIVGALTVHRFLLLRWQGEARVLDAPEQAPPAADVPGSPLNAAAANPVMADASTADVATAPVTPAVAGSMTAPASTSAGQPAPPAGRPRPARAPSPVPAPIYPERFLVRKLRKEFLIAASDIEWVQAQANYVGLHVNGHDYLLRSTMTEFARQLDPRRFVQVHRSYLVNLDHIAEIEPQDSGDARLRMRDGTVVPCSRRCRDALDPSRRS